MTSGLPNIYQKKRFDPADDPPILGIETRILRLSSGYQGCGKCGGNGGLFPLIIASLLALTMMITGFTVRQYKTKFE